jgi:hypothetical protein
MKVTITAWLTKHSRLTPEQIANATGEQLVDSLSFTNLDMATQGYTKVGTATIEFDLIDRQEMIDNKVVALRAELQGVKADAQVKVQRLEEQLQSLLAIEN